MDLFNDTETLWLNLTNIGLGLVTIVCVAVVGRAIFQDLLVRVRQRSLARQDVHAMIVPGLGLTMADGGEPVTRDKDQILRRPAEDPATPDDDPPHIVRSVN